ncbi:MAG: 16S rRNA (guanine(966)-N(2))-methyltransferase RsmD [Acidimicrobiales bacterium]|nr:16S rRNA (guanine(966)-N(2))-methyltransferase RsmD [Acidimicrobiales bacterium]
MRVVAGTARGRTLVAPPGARTRPTTDRVREAVFNALWSRGALEGARVVDLFAGSGALGVEALSRGAAHATFVDSDRAARAAIRRNLEACGLADRATVVAAPVERWVAAHGGDERFDLVFCDPPYAFDRWAELLSSLPADLVVIEAAAPVALPAGWALERQSRYGGTWVGFAVPPPGTATA